MGRGAPGSPIPQGVGSQRPHPPFAATCHSWMILTKINDLLSHSLGNTFRGMDPAWTSAIDLEEGAAQKLK